jgi:AraC-like DNA-binding protein
VADELTRSASLTGYADLCRTLGLDPYRLAAQAGAPAAALTDPDLKLPAAAVGRMLELAARRAGVDDFGVRLAETRRLSNMGAVALVAREQPSLRGALEVMAQYQWLQNEALALTLDEAGDVAIASLRLVVAGGQTARQAMELSCGVLCRNIRALMGERWRPQAVLFRHGPPASLAIHRRVFGVAPQFGQDLDGLVLARAELAAPLAAADPAMARQAERLVRQLAQARSRSASDRVSELIVLLLPTGGCTADRVARHLGCDRRTLHRRLAAEGASFTGLLAARRHDLVRSLLADPRRSMAQVADLAGFASPSSFSHWARRTFGAAPRAVRRQLA